VDENDVVHTYSLAPIDPPEEENEQGATEATVQASETRSNLPHAQPSTRPSSSSSQASQLSPSDHQPTLTPRYRVERTTRRKKKSKAPP